MRRSSALIAGLVCLTISPVASAETYPARQVRVLAGYPPGGATDVIGRILNDTLTNRLGQSFYLEGKPGAAGNLAGEILANAAPVIGEGRAKTACAAVWALEQVADMRELIGLLA